MADLTTSWLGLTLPSPIVVGACPLGDDLDAVTAAVEAGAGAIVLRSLFEEQLTVEQMAAHGFMDALTDTDAEASSFLPDTDVFSLGAEPYLRHLRRLRDRLAVPVVASLNGVTPGGWTDFSRALEAGGASAIELNLYDVPTSIAESSADVEARQIAVVKDVVAAVSIPVNVKLGPFYAGLPGMVKRIEEVGAKGVAVFNRFYQPDIDLEKLDVDRRLHLSSSAALPLRLHALAVLQPLTHLSLACTGGVHNGTDAAKAILSGAHVVQLASILLSRGPRHVAVIRGELASWLASKGYVSVEEARGVLGRASTPDPHAWERLNYIRVLDGWRPRH